MSSLRIVVHKGLDKNNKVLSHAVEACGRLIPFFGDFILTELCFENSCWMDFGWATTPNISSWKDHASKRGCVRFQRITYTVDSLKKRIELVDVSN